MGQKIHPVGMRLGITRTWDSRWFEKKHYVEWLHEDVAIRKSFNRWMRSASISKIEIERRANQARVIVNTAKPGIIIGKRGVGIDDIRKNLEKLTGKSIAVNVMEIPHPEIDARLVAQNIVDQLEKRIAFRRAMKQAIMRTMRAGARGVKVQVSGRLGGAEIARTEHNADGKVPLHTLRADIDYAQVEAFTTFGRIGVKVWIYRGEVLPDQPRGDGALRDRPERTRERRERGGRGRGRDGRPPSGPPIRPAIPAPEPVVQAPANSEPIAVPIEPVAAEPVAPTEPVAAVEQVAAVEPVASAEPVAAAEPVPAIEPVAAVEPVVSAEPITPPDEVTE
jgi:small subunit ribosomal protein S3